LDVVDAVVDFGQFSFAAQIVQERVGSLRIEVEAAWSRFRYPVSAVLYGLDL
jgi:hypothetical protein